MLWNALGLSVEIDNKGNGEYSIVIKDSIQLNNFLVVELRQGGCKGGVSFRHKAYEKDVVYILD